MPRTGRNETCTCGSGRKYKHCHGASITASPELAATDRREVEATISNPARMMRDEEFTSINDAQSFLDAHIDLLNSGDVPAPTSSVEAAQSVMYEAWDATGRERIRLAREALAISADCADAYVLLAEDGAATSAEAVALYREGVTAGERHLGERLQSDAGHFWGEIDTRPYLRARAGLAEALWEVGRKAEALEHMWELLRLNPNDNQGVRDALLPRPLAQHDHASAHRLIDMFDEDGTAIFAYGRALLVYAEEGATATADRALDSAVSTNEFVPPYLLGLRRVPRKLPDTMGFGDQDEGVICAAHHFTAWASVQGATTWLGDRWPGPAGSPVHGNPVTAGRVRPSRRRA